MEIGEKCRIYQLASTHRKKHSVKNQSGEILVVSTNRMANRVLDSGRKSRNFEGTQDSVQVRYLKKYNSLIDFLLVLPEMVTNATKCSHIIKGFSSPGIVDVKFNKYPDFNTILTTYRRDFTETEYILCYKLFTKLFTIFHQSRHIPDKDFKRLGF